MSKQRNRNSNPGRICSQNGARCVTTKQNPPTVSIRHLSYASVLCDLPMKRCTPSVRLSVRPSVACLRFSRNGKNRNF